MPAAQSPGSLLRFNRLLAVRFFRYGIDYVGHGLSDGIHAYIPDFDALVDDVDRYFAECKAKHPGMNATLATNTTRTSGREMRVSIRSSAAYTRAFLTSMPSWVLSGVQSDTPRR